MESDLPVKVLEVLKKATKKDVEDFKVTVHAPNKKGEGYLSQIFFVSLEDRDGSEQYDLIVKQAFSEKNIRELHPVREAFLNEIFFYKTLWPKVQKLQENIPPKLRFHHLPRYFASSCEENFESLVAENLKRQGFVLHDKKKPLNKEHFEMMFKVYGKFHAASFAYKALHPEEFSELVQQVGDLCKRRVTTDKNSKDSIRLSYESVLNFFQPGIEDEIIQKLKTYVSDGVELFLKSLTSGKYTCLTHGDCWSNNMMYKYDDSGNLTDLRFLDFQMVRLGSPICDLSYCLYSGGTKEIFDDLDHLLHVYHDTLSESLRAYGCDPEQVFPWEVLKNDWKVDCQLGIAMGIIIWRGKLTFDEAMIDLTDISEQAEDVAKFFETKHDDVAFKERVRDIFFHIYENNYMY